MVIPKYKQTNQLLFSCSHDMNELPASVHSQKVQSQANKLFTQKQKKKPKHLFGTALLTKKIHCLKKIRIWHLGLPPPSTFMSRCQSIQAPRTKSLSNLLACNSVSSSVEPSFTHFGCTMRNKFSLRENFFLVR